MAVPDYCDVRDLEDRLGIAFTDTREGVLQQAVTAASRWVEKQTARRFYTVAETRYYSARWHYPRMGYGMAGFGEYPWGNPERPNGGGVAGQHLAIDDFVSVSAIASDDNGDGTFPSTWTVGRDYWLGPRNALADGKPYRSVNRNQVTGLYVFPPWENGVSVTGACGYSATVPDPIRELSLWVAMLLARPVMEMSIPGVKSYTLTSDISVTMSPEELPEAMRAILVQYTAEAFGM